MQAPINSKLGKAAGTFAAASISFLIGTAILLAITALSGWKVDLASVGKLQWYYFTDALLGAAYVKTVHVCVRKLEAGGVTAAAIAGQLPTDMLLDWMGAHGMP